MTAQIIPFPAPAPPRLIGLAPGTWVHDLVRGRPMQISAASINHGRVIAYTLFDPAFGIDVHRLPSQVEAARAGGAA